MNRFKTVDCLCAPSQPLNLTCTPCDDEIDDDIDGDVDMRVNAVQSARETLENAIRMVEASDKWKARVVYGDTDSMFVLLPGRSAASNLNCN